MNNTDKLATNYVHDFTSQKIDLGKLSHFLLDLKKQVMPFFRVSATCELLIRNGKYGSLKSRILDLQRQLETGQQYDEFQQAISKSLSNVSSKSLEKAELFDITMGYFGEQYKDHYEQGIVDPLESLLTATSEHLSAKHPLKHYNSFAIKDTHGWDHDDDTTASVEHPGWYAVDSDKAGNIRSIISTLRLTLQTVEMLGIIANTLAAKKALKLDQLVKLKEGIKGIYDLDREENFHVLNLSHTLNVLKNIKDKKYDNYNGDDRPAFHFDQSALQHHINYIEQRLLPLIDDGKDLQEKLYHHVKGLAQARKSSCTTSTSLVKAKSARRSRSASSLASNMSNYYNIFHIQNLASL